jgi:hypothetical protein
MQDMFARGTALGVQAVVIHLLRTLVEKQILTPIEGNNFVVDAGKTCYLQVGMSPLGKVKMSPFGDRAYGGLNDGGGSECLSANLLSL